MVKNNKNFEVTQGDTFTLKMTCKQPDPASTDPKNPNYIPLDITGFTFFLEVSEKPGSSQILASASINDGITVLDATNGIVLISISSEKTSKFNYPKSAYQLRRTDQYGNKDTLLQGWFIVNPGVIND